MGSGVGVGTGVGTGEGVGMGEGEGAMSVPMQLPEKINSCSSGVAMPVSSSPLFFAAASHVPM